MINNNCILFLQLNNNLLNTTTMKKLLFLFFLVPFLGISQQITIRGVVTDGAETLPSVSIVEKGTVNGTSTGFNGNYEIKVNPNSILEFSFVGFKTKLITLKGDSKTINVILEEDAQTLEEVVVQGFVGVVGKARKRVSSVQSTPESVTAFNSKGIENAGINNVANFAKLVPNLKLSNTQAAGVNFLTVRGIPQIRNADAPVAFVIDGVTIPDPSLLNQELFDIALIEIVKGPQGALYGKNAIGGAINIYSKEPTNKSKNSFKFGVGNGGAYEGQFISSGAIKEDKTFYRLSAQYKSFDGLLTNETVNKKADFNKDFNLRAQIITRFSPDFKLSTTLQYIKGEAGATYYSVNPTGNIFVAGSPGGELNPNPSKGDNIIAGDEFGNSDLKNLFGNINLEYSFDNVKLQSITSYNNVKRSLSGDLDFTPFDDFTQGERAETKTFNQEIRLSSRNNDSKFSWSTGAFYQNLEKPFFQDGINRDFTDFSLFYAVAADVVNTTRTFAVFGFSDYKLTDKLTAAVGFRYDFDKFSQDDLLANSSTSRSNDVFQPKVSLSYQATKKALIYANYGRGYRTGGFNPAVTDRFNRDFKDELTDNYELGFKTSWWDNRFILNGSAFYTDFTNQQQYAFDLTTFFAGNYNYNKSKIVGFELDTKLRVFKYLDVLFNYGLINSEIKEGGQVGGANGTATDLSSFNGNKTPFVPTSNFNLGFESNFSINKIKVNTNISLNGTGKIYWNETNEASATSDAYQLLDARVNFSYKNWSFTVWGKNILDKQYYLEFWKGAQFGGFDDFGWRGRPASFGTTVTLKL
jgi:iron complex outermembrane receptor protein